MKIRLTQDGNKEWYWEQSYIAFSRSDGDYYRWHRSDYALYPSREQALNAATNYVERWKKLHRAGEVLKQEELEL